MRWHALAAAAQLVSGVADPPRAEHCQLGTPKGLPGKQGQPAGHNPGCADGECCAASSPPARNCLNHTDCAGCGACSSCFESHTFAGNWCDRPPAVYQCDSGSCVAAPPGAAGVDLSTCQRVCLKDGYACQDHQCVPRAGGINQSQCAQICKKPR